MVCSRPHAYEHILCWVHAITSITELATASFGAKNDKHNRNLDALIVGTLKTIKVKDKIRYNPEMLMHIIQISDPGLRLSQYGGYFTESQTCQTQDQTEDEDEDEEDPEDPENPAPQIDPAQRKQDSTDRRGAGCFNMFRNIGHHRHSLTPHHPSIIRASSEHLHQLWPPRLVSDVWLFNLELMDGCGTKTFNH